METPFQKMHDENMKFVGDTCEHKFVHFDTIKSTESSVYQIGWIRTDRFYCEKCLEFRFKEQKEWSRDKPNWY